MRVYLVFFFGLLFGVPQAGHCAADFLLLKIWRPSQQVDGWLMSEKLDGVRARWDGHHIVSRGGHVFAAPDWFIKGFPPFALDGELWSKRGCNNWLVRALKAWWFEIRLRHIRQGAVPSH